jgi:acyl-coenzyme A thioesterase PaaI-like protein
MEEHRAAAARSTKFSALMRAAERSPGQVQFDVPPDWMQGRSVYGGLQAAVAVEAMRTLVPKVTLRAVQATFVAPVASGLVRAEARVMRQGKSAVHVEARIVDGGDVLAVFVGVFGVARASKASRLPIQPHVEASAPREFTFVPGLVPSFAQHFEARWLRGVPPFSAQPIHEQVVEIGVRDDGPVTEGHVIAIADFVPPVALAHLEAPAPASTLTWMLEFLGEDVGHLPLGGFRVDAELISARDGYTNQSVTVWGPDGSAVALSRQTMVVFG